MYACDTEKIHRFKAITFRQGTTPITAPKISNSITTSREKFIKAKNHFEENPIANIPTESITDMRVEKATVEATLFLSMGYKYAYGQMAMCL